MDDVRYINVGALRADTSERFKSKKAMAEAIKEGNAAFDQTAFPQDGSLPGIIEVSDLKKGMILSVVGPDPYKSRRWYANVYIGNKSGKVTVK